MAVDENVIEVRVQFNADLGNLNSALRTANTMVQQLALTSAKMSQITGKVLPNLDQQVLTLRALAEQGDKVAAALVNAVRSQRMFYTAFSGNVKQNLAALFKNQLAYQHFFKNLKDEFQSVVQFSTKTGAIMGTVADDVALRWRFMASVMVENMERITSRMIVLGKQAQWVGRQLIVGVTTPVVGAFFLLSKQFLELSRAETELTKFMMDAGRSVESLSTLIERRLRPQFQKLSIETATAQEETVKLAASWVAAGFDNDRLLVRITKLTEQLAALTQGDLELAEAQELVRSIMATFFDQTEKGVQQTERVLHQLQLIQSITSLQMADIARSLPLVSSVAKTLGILPGEIAAMLAGMRQLGVQASVAANALKFGLARLAEPTQEAAETFEGITGTTLGQLLFKGGRPRGIKAIEELAAMFEDLTQEQQVQLASMLFGNRQYDRFLKLMQAIRTPVSDYNKAIEATKDQTRADAFWTKQLDTVMQSLGKQWDRFIVRLKVLAARLGEMVLPKMMSLVEVMLKLLDAIDRMPDGIKNLIISLASLAAALGPLIYTSAFVFKLVPGNIGRLVPFTLRRVFGVRGIEAPELLANVPGLAAQVAAGLPVGAGARLLPFEAASLRQTLLRAILQKLPEGTVIPDEQVALLQKLSLTNLLRMAAGQNIEPESFFLSRMGTKFVEGGAGQVRPVVRGASGRFVSLQPILDALGIGIATTVTKGASEGVVEGLEQGVAKATAPARSRTIFGRLFEFLKTLFGSFTRGFIVAGPRGDLTTLMINFTSSLPKIIALVATATGVLAHWREIWEGLRPAIAEVSKILGEAFQEVVRGVTEAITGEKLEKGSEVWRRFGQIIGELAVALAKALSFWLKLVAAIAVSAPIRILREVFELISAIVVGISTLSPANFWKTLTQGGLGFMDVLGGIVGLVTSIALGFRLWNRLVLPIFDNMRLAVLYLIDAFRGVTGAAMGFRAAIAAIGFKGWIGIILAVSTAISLLVDMFRKTDDAAKSAAASISQLRSEVQKFIETARDLRSKGEVQAFLSETQSFLAQVEDRIGKVVASFEEFGDTIPLTERIRAVTNALIPTLSRVNSLTDRQIELMDEQIERRLQQLRFERLFQQEQIRTAQMQIAQLTAEMERLSETYRVLVEETYAFSRSVTVAGDPRDLLEGRERREFIERQIEILEGVIEQARNRLAVLAVQIPALETAFDIIFDQARMDDFADGVSRITGLLEQMRRQLGMVPGTARRAKRALEDTFSDALANQLGQVADAFVSDVLEAFDRQTEAMVAGVQRQIDAIDAQIEKIEELNQKEQELQEDREYRQRRAEMLRQMELNSAIAAVERMIAIHKGEFDEARLISLQAVADAEEARRQIRDLDREREQQLRERRRQHRIDALQQRQEMLQARIERIEEQRSRQRTVLEHMLEDLTEFGARSVEEWKKMRDDILRVVDDFGVDLNDISKVHLETFGRTLHEELVDALRDAREEASRSAQDVGKTIGDSMAEGMSKSGHLKQIAHLMDMVANFEQLMARRHQLGLTQEEITEAFREFADKVRNLIKKTFHSGGYVSGVGEIPAILQSGEYVLNRRAVQTIGKHNLDLINDNEPPRYHLGGLVEAATTATVGAMGASLGPGAILAGRRIGEAISIRLIELLGRYLSAVAGPKVPTAPPTVVKGRGPFMVFPIAGRNYSYSDSFGAPRPGGRTHQGVDIFAPMGTPVVATFPGTVENATNTLGGLSVRVRGAKGYTYNAHLSRFAGFGAVRAGQVIGFVGNTGNAIGTPPHLHFEWHPGFGAAVNPYPYLRAVDPKVKGLATGGVVRFNTPAIVHAGETIVPAHVTRALSRAGSQPPVVNVNVTIEGDIYGDENSYRKLYETLERVGNKLAARRGADNIHLRVT